MKATRSLSYDKLSPDRNINPGLPEYERRSRRSAAKKHPSGNIYERINNVCVYKHGVFGIKSGCPVRLRTPTIRECRNCFADGQRGKRGDEPTQNSESGGVVSMRRLAGGDKNIHSYLLRYRTYNVLTVWVSTKIFSSEQHVPVTVPTGY